MTASIFKAYDIRGIYPTEINEDVVYAIAQAYVKRFNVEKMVVGADVRESSPSLKKVFIEGLRENGVTVIDIGTISTDMMYFATALLRVDGGVTISASHNPREYNGLKMVLKDAVPIGEKSGLLDLKTMIASGENLKKINAPYGGYSTYDILPEYIAHVKSFINFDLIKDEQMKIVANGNFGMAGTVVQALMKGTSAELVLLNEKPDGTFPKGRPDPLRPESRAETIELVKKTAPNFAVAWDADADRCFFYDEQGEFIEGYYITALLATIVLRKYNRGKVIYDPRLVWANRAAVVAADGVPLVNRAGHTFIKERMRVEDAVFAGETSAHYYFKDNYYADNGMIPFLLVLQELCMTGKKLSELVAPWKNTYLMVGETNFTVENPEKIMELVKTVYQEEGGVIDEIDGVSVEFPQWRFNIRSSNTEPLLRLNIESLDKDLLAQKFTEVKKIITEDARVSV